MRVSVVIPTMRRPEPLARTLAALERQTLDPGAYEVLVVADPEDDRDAVAAAVRAGGRRMATRLLEGAPRNASASRNAGWRAARAPVVLFLGDDILGVPELLAEHLDWHDRRGGERVGVLGHVRWAPELRPTPFMRWLDRGIQFDYGSIAGDEASWFNLYTANVSLSRAALEAVGGFDAERFPFLYEDLDLGLRLHESGGLRLLYNRRAVGEHLHAPTVEDYKRRMTAVGAAERRWVEERPEMPAYFHDRLAEAAARPPARGRGRALLRWVDPDTPLVGRRAWASADLFYRQALAPAFMDGWERRR
jgi:glycosyltransferase involved in cell wall biosynthesis